MFQITGSYSDNVVTMKVFIFTNGRPCNLVVIYMSEELSASTFRYGAFGGSKFSGSLNRWKFLNVQLCFRK
jgi:hypothetical protein